MPSRPHLQDRISELTSPVSIRAGFLVLLSNACGSGEASKESCTSLVNRLQDQLDLPNEKHFHRLDRATPALLRRLFKWRA